jgi:RNA recognition motif-containing protein
MASRFYQLYVSKLPWTVCRDQLTRYFQKFGEVSAASIAFDWETGFSRGFGFVQFKEDSAASAALRVSHEIAGTKVTYYIVHSKI